ncbi:YcnI family protein [Saccharibacillus sp. JS10]|uniref:YcnI family copper-binding membrane protein n=1 Tax=Saccharibacillus sp. JS10 TaxID=2950552 RepID=UPI00210DBF3B|nr:DUF1775 domain-containing protein [Saccharibacillus sp. JS10]MCQ4085302.1 DUF1775 domain-containing protein [Saccharibacillus sp. JS10]
MKIKSMNHTFKKIMTLAAPATAAFLLFATVASAHVTVLPKESATGAWETYTMKVPVEKDVNTNKVVLKMPEGVEFQQYEPIPGWTTTVDESAGTVTWEAEGDGIGAGQFQRFTFVAKNPAAEGEVAWDAFQYYTDGSIVEWTGDENAATPHSMTMIGAAAGETTANAHGQAVGTDNAADEATTDESAVSDPAEATTDEASTDTATDPATAEETNDASAVSDPTAVPADAPSDAPAASTSNVLLYITLALSIVAIALSGAALATRKRK